MNYFNSTEKHYIIIEQYLCDCCTYASVQMQYTAPTVNQFSHINVIGAVLYIGMQQYSNRIHVDKDINRIYGLQAVDNCYQSPLGLLRRLEGQEISNDELENGVPCVKAKLNDIIQKFSVSGFGFSNSKLSAEIR